MLNPSLVVPLVGKIVYWVLQPLAVGFVVGKWCIDVAEPFCNAAPLVGMGLCNQVRLRLCWELPRKRCIEVAEPFCNAAPVRNGVLQPSSVDIMLGTTEKEVH